MIRWLGAACVIFATSYAGYEYSRQVQQRIIQLNTLIKILTDLYSDVEYGSCTLMESFLRIGEGQESMYRAFLIHICEGMKSGKPFSDIFSEAIKKELKTSSLTERDKKELLRLGGQLGNHQKNGQLRVLQLHLDALKSGVEELEQSKREKQKIGQILGVSAGVLIVILLL